VEIDARRAVLRIVPRKFRVLARKELQDTSRMGEAIVRNIVVTIVFVLTADR